MGDTVKTALITGASSGIGAEYARQLARTKEFNLILVARRLDRLKELQAEIQASWQQQPAPARWVRYFQVDLISREERAELFKTLSAEKIAVDLLINNAGFGSVAPFLETDQETLIRMVELNDIAPLVLCHHFVKHMCARGRGAVINVSSTASFQPLPHMTVYAATKAFLTSFSLALSAEVRRFGVTVLAQCPGPTMTEFHLVSGLPEKMTFIPSASVDTVVAEALRALDRRKRLVVNGWLNRALSTVARVLPYPVVLALTELILRRKSAVGSDRLAHR